MNLLFLLPDYFFRDTYYEYMWIVDAIIDGIGDKDFNRFGCQAKIYCGNELKILIVERRRDIENYFVEIPSLGLFNQRKAFPPLKLVLIRFRKDLVMDRRFPIKIVLC